MNNRQPTMIRIDSSDSRSQAARAAEQRLFAHYGLTYQEQTVELTDPGLRVRVLDVGSGPPLLMVPGGVGDAAIFAPLMATLQGWRCIVINRPGGGLSDGVDHRQVDMRELAVNTLSAVADAFDLECVPIIGNSMGGLWSFYFTLAHPQRVSRMVQLGCPALALDSSAPFFMRLLAVPLINNPIARSMQPNTIEESRAGLRHMGSSPAQIEQLSDAMAEAVLHLWHLPTFTESWKTLIGAVTTLRGVDPRYRLSADSLARVECPVQLIWGENDPFGGLDVGRRMLEIMSDARLHEMDTGHLPFLDDPQETGRIVNSFLMHESSLSGQKLQPALVAGS